MSLDTVHDLVIFDGVCNLCAHSVRFILKCEADSDRRFVPFQSPAGARLLRQYDFDPEDVQTLVLVSDGRTSVKSDAALEIARHFRWPWKGLMAIRVVPRLIRNWLYDRIAQNRYRWFGRNAMCMVPTAELRTRFIMTLGWEPLHNFEHILDRLRRGEDHRSALTRRIGSKGYHVETFMDWPYPVE